MPLLKIKNVQSDVTLGLWQITESVDAFLSTDDALRQVYSTFNPSENVNRTRERLAVYALLRHMKDAGTPLLIEHLDTGRPQLPGCHIGISHTKGFAALILSKTRPVGVDIEYHSDRVNRVAERFIRLDEVAETTASRLINWCAKETIYKLFSDEHLDYFDMRLRPFTLQKRGTFEVEDLKIPKLQEVSYVVEPAYVLTYSVGMPQP